MGEIGSRLNKTFLNPCSRDKALSNTIYDKKNYLILILKLSKAEANLGPVFIA
jgi:hypothetical protein